MNLKWFVAVTLLLVGVACTARTVKTPVVHDSDDFATAVLTVNLLGLESDSGKVAVALYDSAGSFEDRSGAVATAWIEPHGGVVSWSVEDLAPGVYAVAVYHDLNGNGELDRSALGPPDEPYGFSNDVRGTFGPPRFEKAAIGIGPGPLTIEITLR